MEIERIVTHNDFDGIVSAALCSRALGCDEFFFTGPTAVTRAQVSIGPADAVCDLPYPLECGMWFDHHSGNLEELRLRGIDPAAIPGCFAERPSCARVVLEYFTAAGIEFPPHLLRTVEEADVIDSFAYHSVEEWRSETPGKLVDMGLKAPSESFARQIAFLERVTLLVRDGELAAVAEDPEVAARGERFRQEEQRMLRLVEEAASFLEQDARRELVVLDFTAHKRRPRVMRNLAYLLHPAALGALAINSQFRGGTKTNDLSFSLSLSMNLTGRDHGKDAGEIMRALNIGDGHPGAAAGSLHCGSKQEMLREKKRIVGEIWRLWSAMRAGG